MAGQSWKRAGSLITWWGTGTCVAISGSDVALDETSQAVCATSIASSRRAGQVACAREPHGLGGRPRHVPRVLHALSNSASAHDGVGERPEATYYEIYHDVLPRRWSTGATVMSRSRSASGSRQQLRFAAAGSGCLLLLAFVLITVPGWLYSFTQHHRAEASARAARVAAIA
jgi:hypothetical protein